MIEGKPARREDSLLDAISELIRKRESTLRQLKLWEETDPQLQEMVDDIRLCLL